MTSYTIVSGYDTWIRVSEDFDGSPDPVLFTAASAEYALVYLPLPVGLAGSTIASATLTGNTPSASGNTVHVWPATGTWSASAVRWPGPSVGTAEDTVVSTTGPVDLDVTSIVQAAANGQPWYGVRVGTSSITEVHWNSFESGADAWILTIETTTAPEKPTKLTPANGTVVGSGAPVLTCDFTDNGGLTNDMAAMNVQVSTSTSFTSPAYDQTGNTTVPVFDLSSPPAPATAFTAVSSGTTRYWRVRVQDSDGNWSDWSDVASFTYRTQPTLTINTPAAGIVYDPTTVIDATASANLSAYRVRVTEHSDRTGVAFDTGRLSANPSDPTHIQVALPQKYNGTRVLVDDRDYNLHIQAWDTYTSRQSTTGSPAWVDSWTTFHFDDDLAVIAPDSLVADQTDTGPSVTLTWTCAALPDGWVILRDGKVINRSDGTDVIAGVSTYSWVDQWPSQWVNHDYTVKAVQDMGGGDTRQSVPSPTASVTPNMQNLWLFTQDGSEVFLSGVTFDQLTVADRRTTYKPINLAYDVDVVTGFEGLSGTVSGVVLTDEWQDAVAAQSVLLAIRANPAQSVRLVYGTFSGEVLLRNVGVLPHPNANSVNQAMNVTFGVNQVGDFDSVMKGATA